MGRGMLRMGTGMLWISYRRLSRRMLESEMKGGQEYVWVG